MASSIGDGATDASSPIVVFMEACVFHDVATMSAKPSAQSISACATPRSTGGCSTNARSSRQLTLAATFQNAVGQRRNFAVGRQAQSVRCEDVP